MRTLLGLEVDLPESTVRRESGQGSQRLLSLKGHRPVKLLFSVGLLVRVPCEEEEKRDWKEGKREGGRKEGKRERKEEWGDAALAHAKWKGNFPFQASFKIMRASLPWWLGGARALVPDQPGTQSVAEQRADHRRSLSPCPVRLSASQPPASVSDERLLSCFVLFFLIIGRA